ncbi:hypothetical protein [Litorihabitans aurantiacus]|uniref:Uncharacterized protein n=1 Tax=Litorihabitans aurantiacus TaxID=1930061 RepID=A0AA37XGX3_9MICO|nr:hypothetical protein [Litorihabitans aurantiacus]GMA32510.1 hypothetical protein GCM10025875_25020 [Litorihabitans aurantiacus]
MNDDDRTFAPRDDEGDGGPESTHAHGLEETVLARLRAADPAADVEPRADLAADVVRRASEAEGGATTGATGAEDGDGEPPAVVPLVSRRPRWFVPAAAAAAALVIGASGYALGADRGSDVSADSAGTTADEVAMAPASGPITLGSGESGANESGAMGSPEPATAGDASASRMSADSMIGWGGRTTFSASNLSTTERSAQAYGLDAATPSTPERMAQVAAAVGMTGAPEIVDGAWTLTEGTKQLSAYLDGSLNLSFYDEAAQPWCEGCEEPRPQDAPSGDAAIERLKEVLTALGEDTAAFEYSAPTYEGAVTATAQARRVVDGQTTDVAFTLDLAPAGVASVSGTLAGLVDLGTYTVVSEQEGFERLSDPRFGSYRTGWPRPIDGDMTTMQEWEPPTQAPAAPSPGTTVSWPVEDVEIVSARLGLAQQWQPDGEVLLVPSYEFTDADGGTWSVIAVADDQLDFTSTQP